MLLMPILTGETYRHFPRSSKISLTTHGMGWPFPPQHYPSERTYAAPFGVVLGLKAQRRRF
jgi:hypothetical protein